MFVIAVINSQFVWLMERFNFDTNHSVRDYFALVKMKSKIFTIPSGSEKQNFLLRLPQGILIRARFDHTALLKGYFLIS
jgi:hypothetical protein